MMHVSLFINDGGLQVQASYSIQISSKQKEQLWMGSSEQHLSSANTYLSLKLCSDQHCHTAQQAISKPHRTSDLRLE
jgi:hypothetical protein